MSAKAFTLAVVAIIVLGHGSYAVSPAAAVRAAPSFRLQLPLVSRDGPEPLPVPIFPPRNDNLATQEDSCGPDTVLRQRPQGVNGESFLSDTISVVRPEGAPFNLPSRPLGESRSRLAGYTIDWCYDLDLDGTPELLIAFWPGGTNGVDLTLLELGSEVSVRWTFHSSQSLHTGLLLDELAPYPLVIADRRFRYYASPGALGLILPLVVRLDGNTPSAITGEFPNIVRPAQIREISRFLQCGAYQDCQRGALLGVMATSLLLGEWDQVKQTLPVDGTLLGAFDRCRFDVELMLDDPSYQGNDCLGRP